MNYQQEIDKLNKAAALKQDITLTKVAEGLLIKFPAEFEPEKIAGTISFQRPSNVEICRFQVTVQ